MIFSISHFMRISAHLILTLSLNYIIARRTPNLFSSVFITIKKGFIH